MRLFDAGRLLVAGGLALAVSAPAASATVLVQNIDYSPWAAIAAFASPSSAQALCREEDERASALERTGIARDRTRACALLPLQFSSAAPPFGNFSSAAPFTFAGAPSIYPLVMGLAPIATQTARLMTETQSAAALAPLPVSPS